MTPRRRTSWSGCARSMSGPPFARALRSAAPNWCGAMPIWIATMLELYHWEPNGSWLKPLVALHEKRLEFRSHYMDVLSFEQYRPEFLRPSPETQVRLEGE